MGTASNDLLPPSHTSGVTLHGASIVIGWAMIHKLITSTAANAMGSLIELHRRDRRPYAAVALSDTMP